MATKQSRKAISMSGATYARVQTYCQEHGTSISGFVETLVDEFLNAPKEKPFTMGTLKKEPLTVTKGPIRGGGIHSL